MAGASGGGGNGSAGTAAGRTPLLIGLVVVLILALVGLDVLFLAIKNPNTRLGPHYYLALGDSISYGYQPDLNFTSGFVDDVFADLHPANITDLENYACGGDTTTTMIQGDCLGRLIKHNAYTGAQLSAAVSFLKAHKGQVNPVTLEIGSNDVLGDFQQATCTVDQAKADADLQTMDTNLTQTILPQLLDALHPTTGQVADFFMLNYYNPFAKECPNSGQVVHDINDHLAADAKQFSIPMIDVYTAFGGDDHQADHICDYTWICSSFHDFHPTNAGYKVIATAVERALSYPTTNPNLNPLAVPTVPADLTPAAEAARRASAWL